MAQAKVMNLTFENGLLEQYEDTQVPNGFATILKNWEPEPNGGLRTRTAWIASGTTGQPAVRKGRGIGRFATVSGGWYVVANAPNATSYTLYSLPATDLEGGAYTAIETIAVANSGSPVAFATGMGSILYTSTQFATGRRWDGTAAAGVAGVPAAATIAFHAERFFTGGTLANPSRLWWSEPGDYTTWNADNYVDIGLDAGDPLRTLAVFQDSLLIGKRNGVYRLTGKAESTFDIEGPFEDGQAAVGRSIIPTPYGAVIMGTYAVWMFDGDTPRRISGPVQDIITGAEASFFSGAYLDGKVFLEGYDGDTTLLVYDCERDVWTTETSSSADEMPGSLYADRAQRNLVMAPKNASLGTLLQYREVPPDTTATRSHDASRSITYQARSGDIALAGIGTPATLQHVFVRYRQRGGSATHPDLTLTVYADGTALAGKTVEAQAATGVYRTGFRFGSTAYRHQFDLSQTLTSAQESSMDIEAIELYFDVEDDVRVW